MATPDTSTVVTAEKIFVGKGEQPAWLTLGLANRHGLVTGATGTGKTVSLQVMAEGFRAPACRCLRPTSRATCPASPGGSIGRAIVRGALGGLLRR